MLGKLLFMFACLAMVQSSSRRSSYDHSPGSDFHEVNPSHANRTAEENVRFADRNQAGDSYQRTEEHMRFSNRRDVNLTTPQLISKDGYRADTYKVETDDGYILTMHRISGGPVPSLSEGKPVVFLQHGLLCSSADWLILGPMKSLAYRLSDLGYDVWMGNVRGNVYSKEHEQFSTKDEQYWQFTWDEMGHKDIPAQIDYILAVTGQEKLHYIGHSMGTTVALVMLSEKPEYNAKMKNVQLLAPIARLEHSQSPLRKVVPYINNAQWLLDMTGVNEFLPNISMLTFLDVEKCDKDAIYQEICVNPIFLICGYNSQQLNKTVMPSILAHTPAGTSTKTLLHYAQEMKSGHFRKYDYGLYGNLKRYFRFRPPKYDLKKITSPVYIHYSDNDVLANPEDVHWLTTELPNVKGKFRVPNPKFNHMDFVWANEVSELVYKRVLMLMAKDK